jgi:hypothetical protein
MAAANDPAVALLTEPNELAAALFPPADPRGRTKGGGRRGSGQGRRKSVDRFKNAASAAAAVDRLYNPENPDAFALPAGAYIRPPLSST